MKSTNFSSQVDSALYTDLIETFVDKNDVTIVVPTLNEEKAIELVLKDIMLEGYQNILVIDGNSSDDTVKIVKKMKVNVFPQIGRGKTGAIKSALEYIKTPFFVVIDGDYTYSVKDIEALFEKAQFCNQVIGARRDRVNIKRLNRFGNGMINLLFNFSFGTRLTDVCSGLYILKTSFARKMVLETSGFDVEVEIAAQAAESNKIAEVPISYGRRIGIQKLNPVKDGVRIVSSIFRLSKKYNPLIFYSYLAGSTLTVGGVGLTVLDILVSINEMSLPIMNLLSPLITIVGVQLFILAILISQLKHMSKRTIAEHIDQL